MIGELLYDRPALRELRTPGTPGVGPRSRRPAGCPMSTGRRWRPSLQCHLGLCLSLRCDFTLEPFTRGLASENADQHAQRFVAVIARRTFDVLRVEAVDCASLENGS